MVLTAAVKALCPPTRAIAPLLRIAARRCLIIVWRWRCGRGILLPTWVVLTAAVKALCPPTRAIAPLLRIAARPPPGNVHVCWQDLGCLIIVWRWRCGRGILLPTWVVLTAAVKALCPPTRAIAPLLRIAARRCLIIVWRWRCGRGILLPTWVVLTAAVKALCPPTRAIAPLLRIAARPPLIAGLHARG